MRTLALISQKGGSGKTTLALHLATAAIQNGQKTVVLDSDPQTSASTWGDLREEDPKVIAVPATRLAASQQAAMKSGCQFLIIDTAPNAGQDSLLAMKVADYALIPSRATYLDLNAILPTVDLAKTTRVRFSVVFNHCPGVGNEVDEAIAFLKENGVPVCPVRIGQRKIFAHGLLGGRTAQEVDPASKAAIEVEALYGWVTKQFEMKVAA